MSDCSTQATKPKQPRTCDELINNLFGYGRMAVPIRTTRKHKRKSAARLKVKR